jgi:cardiolipin synthase (CMP-forming)
LLTWPNRISITRIFLVGPFVISLLHLQDSRWGEVARWSALGIFLIMAISDCLDGYLARRLHQESAVGRFLDPLADKILVVCSILILAHEGTHVTGMLLPSTVAVIAIGKDLIVILGFAIIYLGTSQIYISPQRSGKWCTTLQLAMITAVLLYPNLPASVAWLPSALWWLASLFAVITVVHYYRIGRHFIAASVSHRETSK